MIKLYYKQPKEIILKKNMSYTIFGETWRDSVDGVAEEDIRFNQFEMENVSEDCHRIHYNYTFKRPMKINRKGKSFVAKGYMFSIEKNTLLSYFVRKLERLVSYLRYEYYNKK